MELQPQNQLAPKANGITCQFAPDAIARTELLGEDGKVARISFFSGDDLVRVLVPTPELDNLIEKLEGVRDASRAMGVKAAETFQYRAPSTWAVGSVPEQPGVCAMIFDKSLVTRIGFMFGAHVARAMGRALIESARDAEQTRTLAAFAPNGPGT